MEDRFTMRAELHVHSDNGIKTPVVPFLAPIASHFHESTQNAGDIIKTAVKKGIRIIAITDHNTLNGYYEAKRIVKESKMGIILVPGCEITTKEGHILAYGIKRGISKWLAAEDAIKEIHKQGGIAVAAHPYACRMLSKEMKGMGNMIFQLKLDGIEGFNAFTGKKENLKAVAAAKKLGLPCTAGSDAHMTEDIGKGVTAFPEGMKSYKDVIRSIKQSNFRTSCRQANILVAGLRHIYKNIKLLLTQRV